ncbi:unnamed protein product [Urochloa decumbens]|uniref:Uncharacterized protein n=1 Tax=Urochloa decumbens TaxID=240449 RepID=A0ABC9A7Z2_9POAL
MTVSGGELKMSWPEVVGMDILTAAKRIHKDRPDMRLEFHRIGDPTEPGYDDKRVRIFIHDDYTVAQTPVVG